MDVFDRRLSAPRHPLSFGERTSTSTPSPSSPENDSRPVSYTSQGGVLPSGGELAVAETMMKELILSHEGIKGLIGMLRQAESLAEGKEALETIHLVLKRNVRGQVSIQRTPDARFYIKLSFVTSCNLKCL